VGAVTSQMVLKVLFYVNILQCFFVVGNFTANAVSVDNGNRLIFEIWWNFFYDLFSIKNVADVNSIDSFVSKRNMKPLGIHHIRTILFSLPVNYLKDLRDFGLDKGGADPFSPKYRLSSIICIVFAINVLGLYQVLSIISG
jgi:hypothetical protein